MFKILRELLCYFIYGKEFKITIQQISRYEQVKSDLDSIIVQLYDGNSDIFYTFKGNECYLIEKELPLQYRFTNNNLLETNYILPQIAAKFFLEGHTWDEISAYDCVRKYGMLAGKKRYLRIINASL